MHSSNLHPSQIDQFHHIARLGVYALLTLSVIAMTVSLNRPGTSVGNSGARATASDNACNDKNCISPSKCINVVNVTKCLSTKQQEALTKCQTICNNHDEDITSDDSCTSKKRFDKCDSTKCTENNPGEVPMSDESCVIVCNLYNKLVCGKRVNEKEDSTPHCKWDENAKNKAGECVNIGAPATAPASPPAGGACRSQSCCPSQTTYNDGTVMGQEQCMGLGLLNVSWEPSTSTCYGCQSNIQREGCSVSYSYDSTLKMLLIQGYQDAPSVHATRSDWDNGSARVIIDGVMYYPQRTGRQGGNDIYLYGVKVSGEVKQRKVTFQLVHNTTFNTFTCNSETLSLPSPEGPTGPQGNGGGAGDTSGGTNLSDYKAEYSNGNVIFSFKGTDEPVAQVMIGGTDFGDIKSGTRSVLVTESNRSLICGNVNWYVQTKKADSSIAGRSDTITSTVTCPSSGTTATTPTLVSYSVSSDGGRVSTDGHTLTISKGHTNEITVKATTSNPSKTAADVWNKGKLNVYSSVDPSGLPITALSEKEVSPEVAGTTAVFTWKFVKPAGQETDFQANFYPGTDKIQERVIIKVVDDPKTCVKVTCANNAKNEYYHAEQNGVAIGDFEDSTCTESKKISNLVTYCNKGAVFNPGTGGAVTIPKRLIIRSHFKVDRTKYNGDTRYVFGIVSPTGNTVYCVKNENPNGGAFVPSAGSGHECTVDVRSDSTYKDFALSVFINGQDEVRSWLTGFGYVWGKPTEGTTTTNSGVRFVTGRGSSSESVDGLVGHLDYEIAHEGIAYERLDVLALEIK